MARKPQDPDRNLSAGDPEENLEGLKNALDHSEPALPYNEAAKLRIGKVISDVVRKTQRRSPRKP
jgi:predicted lipid carrier protein YhbT